MRICDRSQFSLVVLVDYLWMNGEGEGEDEWTNMMRKKKKERKRKKEFC
jgi:hypothetical protein